MRPIRDIFRSYAVLDADGRHVNGSDKESNHRYGDTYEKLFTAKHPADPTVAPWSVRLSVKLMMEVGVSDGSSLLAWSEVFPNALCVGLDIHPSERAHGDRIEFHLGDARTEEACERAATGRQFDLIVDDATHLFGDVFQTLLWLWPYVKAGGLYVVEDLRIQDCERTEGLFSAEVVLAHGPFGNTEPLVVFRKEVKYAGDQPQGRGEGGFRAPNWGQGVGHSY